MLFSVIGYYSLILGLFIGLILVFFSIKNFRNSISINSSELKFVITDFKNEINVTYTGAIPNLFEEGKGVVAEGVLNDRNFFSATKILAKHDENYMPPEVKEALGN